MRLRRGRARSRNPRPPGREDATGTDEKDEGSRNTTDTTHPREAEASWCSEEPCGPHGSLHVHSSTSASSGDTLSTFCLTCLYTSCACFSMAIASMVAVNTLVCPNREVLPRESTALQQQAAASSCQVCLIL